MIHSIKFNPLCFGQNDSMCRSQMRIKFQKKQEEITHYTSIKFIYIWCFLFACSSFCVVNLKHSYYFIFSRFVIVPTSVYLFADRHRCALHARMRINSNVGKEVKKPKVSECAWAYLSASRIQTWQLFWWCVSAPTTQIYMCEQIQHR